MRIRDGSSDVCSSDLGDPAAVGRLATALDFDVRLPKRLLRELKIVVHAQTDTRLMISTMSNISMVRQLLSPFVERREIIEVPFSYAKWIEFETIEQSSCRESVCQ